VTTEEATLANCAGACSTTCQDGYIGLPSGYSLVPYSANLVEHMVKTGGFDHTHVVVFSNGAAVGSRAYSNGAAFGGNWLSTSGSTYKTTGCSLKALMRKPC